MIQQPTTYTPAPAAEFNAIKINIQGAKVDAPASVQPGLPVVQTTLPETTGQNINYTA